MKPTVHARTAWHSSERSENGCGLLYTPVSELGRLWAFKGDCRQSYGQCSEAGLRKRGPPQIGLRGRLALISTRRGDGVSADLVTQHMPSHRIFGIIPGDGDRPYIREIYAARWCPRRPRLALFSRQTERGMA
eukprot:scaffold51165_cov49-Phaeocystis_antarctica.AAC.1